MLTREKYFPRNTGALARADFHRRTFAGACSAKCNCDTRNSAPRGYIFFFPLFFVCSSDNDADSDDDVDVEGRKSGCKWRKNFSTCICTERDGAPNEDMNKGVVTVALCWNMATGIAQYYRERIRAR